MYMLPDIDLKKETLKTLITRLTVIDIEPLTVLFCYYPLFCNCPLADL